MQKILSTLLKLALLSVVALGGLWLAVARPWGGVDPAYGAITADPDRLRAHVQRLAVDFVPRDHTHVDNLNAAAAYIHTTLDQYSDRVEDQMFTAYTKEYKNVIAHFGPDTGPRLVIGAHYDSAGLLPGADDNASGVAGLLELARMMWVTPPTVPVTLVAYTLEEPPYFATDLMGSAVHAQSLKDQGIEIKRMIALEMIGYFTDEPDSQDFPLKVLSLFYPDRGNFIAVVDQFWSMEALTVRHSMQQATPLPVYSISAPSTVPGIDFSDHRNYWSRGYPAVMVTDTAFYRNKAYHTAEDTIDRLDFNRMAMVVQGVFEHIQCPD